MLRLRARARAQFGVQREIGTVGIAKGTADRSRGCGVIPVRSADDDSLTADIVTAEAEVVAAQRAI